MRIAWSVPRERLFSHTHTSRPLSPVVKYRKGDEDTFIDKISKLSMHSIIKKSNRVSSHLKHLTGISPQVQTRLPHGCSEFCTPLRVRLIVGSKLPVPAQIKDEAFDETERRFRLQERLIKSFVRDISLYLQHIRVQYFHFGAAPDTSGRPAGD